MLLRKDLTAIQKQLSHYDEVREQILSLSRTATRMSSSTILDIHKGELDLADNGISKVEQTLGKIESLSQAFSEFRTTQGVVVAYQEYVEASTLLSFARSQRIPAMSELRSDYRSYILGLLDAVGEFRRMALNGLRKGDVKKAEKLLEGMEAIYDGLQTLEHTSIIPTFRVKMDAARRIIESTRGDVVTEVRRYSLEQALDRLEKRIGSHTRT
ncbi:MAG TPA: hypothetical protein VFJ63_01760 [Candidatus Bathyarchaeia archaeon]|nr:hypothetical protein [Candidatus Bathyarchaeia archaeon]